ncbi:MAG: hypothetical protein AUK37_07275 [Rhodobacterales bacterium CG2_30_65_12]|nr:MAG: hypothetical protein AUK37_07275 [Rhodobacterales bacterium CG2_30_65_12]
MRIALLALALAPLPALGGPVCTFSQECYMTLDCEETAYEVTLELDADRISTVAESMEILHYHKIGETTQLVAQGMGALHMLTIGPNSAVMSVHIGAGPAAITYYGACE